MKNKNKKVLILESNPIVSILYLNIIRSINSKVELNYFENPDDFRKHRPLIRLTIVYLAEDFCPETSNLILEIQAAYRKAEIFLLSQSADLKVKNTGVKSLYQPLFADAFSRHLAY